MKHIGAIIARFQVPTLHEGHIHLIREVVSTSDMVIILLGSKVHQPDIRNPFHMK
jgi:bifunctional NMN adenylyltransferase/nudix hydrolase